MREKPKVMVVSHNVFGLDGSMGKTLHDYFKGWPQDRLCQLYFHSEIPTSDVCVQYYRVTDWDLLCALLKFKKPGKVLTKQDIQAARVTTRTDKGTTAKIYQKGRTRKPWMYLARNTLWKFGFWRTKELDRWMRECRPDVIFFASGDYTFSFDIAMYLSKKYDIPMVVSIMDDYYFHRKNNRGWLAKWNTYRFRKTMEKVMEKASGAFYIHPAMMTKYQEKFLLPASVLYKGAQPNESQESDNGNLRISYFGSLGYRRHKALVEIGRTIRELIPDGSVLLDIYSAESRPEILVELTRENGVAFQGVCDAQTVARLQSESNILVLAESDEAEIVEQIRFSLSTKVPEYLASGRCVLAYGGAQTGTISYLLQNQVSCVATNKEELKMKLKEILFSKEERRRYVRTQMDLLRKNHSDARNEQALYQMLRMAVEEK